MNRVRKREKNTLGTVRHACSTALFCFLPAVIFILGSMAGMNLILQRRESRLLQESGTEIVESPVAVWENPQDAGTEKTDMSSGNSLPLLTAAQMEEVIYYRKDAVNEVLHDPVTGQIPMEEAIACGEQWLAEMGFTEADAEGNAEREPQALSRRASLGIKRNQTISEVPMEPYYSFWTVRFSGESVYAVLSVNAVTGRVWDADITLYNDMLREFSWDTLDLFAELAGVQADIGNYMEINDTNTGASLAVRDSNLRVWVRYHDIITNIADEGRMSADDGSEHYEIIWNDNEVAEYYEGRNIRSARIIEFHLDLSGL